MKVIAFNGSPAGKQSATYKIISAFNKGAEKAGAETAVYNLTNYNIIQCKGCFHCWFKSPGKCVLKDDMSKLIDIYQSADIVCFGSPVYSWNMTALLKNFVDRLIPLKSPLITEQSGNYDMQDTVKKQQRYVAVSNCGFPGENNFQIIKASFSCCNPCLEIYRNCGKLLVSANPSVKSIVTEYFNNVEQAGYELVADGKVNADTLELLSRPLMSTQEYIRFLGM